MNLSERIRVWYNKGHAGLETVCATEGAPLAVKEAARHWYAQGDLRLEGFIAEIEQLEKALEESQAMTGRLLG